jgi:hypothetical protein
MIKYVKLPTEKILNLDFSQAWQVTPFLSVTLNEKSINDVVWSEDGTEGTVSYNTIELSNSRNYRFINPATGKEESYQLNQGTYGRPQWFDANTMKEITETELGDLVNAYQSWEISKAYQASEKFKYNGKVYFVIQSHTSQAQWTPDIVPALYRQIPPDQVIAPWKQPAGAHDAYKKRDKVSFNGSNWESTIDANVWQPGIFGWVKI